MLKIPGLKFKQCFNRFSLPSLMIFCTSTTIIGQIVSRNECQNPPPATLFCEDYETSNWRSKWTDPDLSNVVDIIDNGPSQSEGNNTARLRAPADKRGGASMWTDVTPTQRLFARWFMKYEKGFTFTDNNHGGGLAAGNTNIFTSGNRPKGDIDGWALFTYEYQPHTKKPYTYCYYHGMYQDGSTPGNIYGDAFPCVYDKDDLPYYCTKDWHRPIGGMDALPTLTDDKWYCIEQMMDVGQPTPTDEGASGEYRLWIDGQLISQVNDLWIRSSPTFIEPSELYLALFYHDDSHADLGMLYDNVIISSQRVGCGEAISKYKAPILAAAGPSGNVTSPVLLSAESDEPSTIVFDSLNRPFNYKTQSKFSNTGGIQHNHELELEPGNYSLNYQAEDFDGNIGDIMRVSFTVVESSSTQEVFQTSMVTVSPNPFNQSTTIDFTKIRENYKEPLSFEIFNPLGQNVFKSENISGNYLILDKTMAGFESMKGIYIYQILIGGQSYHTGMLMVY